MNSYNVHKNEHTFRILGYWESMSTCGIVAQMKDQFLVFERNHIVFQYVWTSWHFEWQLMKISSLHTKTNCFLLDDMLRSHWCCFNLHFPEHKWCRTFFHILFEGCMSSLWKFLFLTSPHFLRGLLRLFVFLSSTSILCNWGF